MINSLTKKKIPALITAALIFIFLLSITLAMADSMGAVIKGIALDNTRDDLLLFYNVENAFDEKITQAVASGVSTSFTFDVLLKKKRVFLPDKTISNQKLTNIIKYNNLKKEYTVTRSWEAGKPQVTESFEEARKLMTEVKSLKIIPLKELKKGEAYSVKTKVTLSSVTLPLYLHYVLFFLSFWDLETDWAAIDFVY